MPTASSKSLSQDLATGPKQVSAILDRDIRPAAAASLNTEPHDIAAEQSLLGILLYDNHSYEGAVQRLEARFFYEPFHQRLFLTFERQTQEGRMFEPIALAKAFESDPAFEELGGLRYLADLVDRAPPSRVVGDYAELIFRLWQRREGRHNDVVAGIATSRQAPEIEFETYRVRDAAAFKTIPDDTQIFAVPRTEAAEKALEGSPVFERVRLEEERLHRDLPRAIDADQRAVHGDAFRPSARARAILRGIANAEDDLRDAGGSFDIDEVRVLLSNVSRQAVDKRVKEGSLLSVPGPSGRRRFPAIQFMDDGRLVAGLKEIQAALGYSSPWSVLNFLVNVHDMLDGERPIDLLRHGEVARAEQAARLSGIHAA